MTHQVVVTSIFERAKRFLLVALRKISLQCNDLSLSEAKQTLASGLPGEFMSSRPSLLAVALNEGRNFPVICLDARHVRAALSMRASTRPIATTRVASPN